MRSKSDTLQLRFILGLLLAVGMAAAVPCNAQGFSPHTEFATGDYPSAVVTGDLNGDGKRDLVTANYLDQTVSVLLGVGLGVFAPKTDYGTAGPSGSIAIGDLNGDGRLDLAVGNYDDNTVAVLLGNGDGSFGASTEYATGGTTYAVAMGDVNGDGILDLVTANDDADNVSVFLNNGDGTFGAKTDFGTGDLPSGLAIGDLNGDGRLDVVTGNSMLGGFGNTVSVLLGNGDGTFGTNSDFPTGRNPISVAIGDLNGDGKPDVVTGNQVSASPGVWTVSVLLGDGTGSLGAKTDYQTGRSPVSVKIGDLNIDGIPDLVTANFLPANSVSVLPGSGTGSFGARTDYATAPSPNCVAIGDLNGDGLVDLVTSNQESNTVSVLLNLNLPTPTVLVRFDAVATHAGTEIRWQFGEPERVVSASLERAVDRAGPWAPLTLEIRRAGETAEALDPSTIPGQDYHYRLTAHLIDGTQVVFGPVSVTAISARSRSGLTGIAPNPASDHARIDFTMVREERVRISVVDAAGREQEILSDGLMTPGSYSMVWDGRKDGTRLPPGMYFVQWRSAGTTMHRKLILTE